MKLRKRVSINHVKFEGVWRSNENITVDRVGEEGRGKPGYRLPFFLENCLNIDSVEFVLPVTRTPYITVVQRACNPWTEEPCEGCPTHTVYTPQGESLIRSDFQYFVIQ